MTNNESSEKKNVDFDDFTECYSKKINEAISFGGIEHSFFVNIKQDLIIRQARNYFCNVDKLNVLDLGCGIGAYHTGLEGKFRQLYGIDISKQSIEYASKSHSSVKYDTYDGLTLPYPDGFFDLVFTVCVMHHVPTSNWLGFVQEIHRTLKPGGLALVFEHNPYNPATQYVVRSCEIDRDAVLLRPGYARKLFKIAGFKSVNTRCILTVPPSNNTLKLIDMLLGYLPFGAQYYLSATKQC